MRTIDEWMNELGTLGPVVPEATNDGLDRLWAAILNEGEYVPAEELSAHK